MVTVADLKIYASVPASLRIRRRQSVWAGKHRPGLPTDCFLEGPSFDRDGWLYVVDVAWGRILRCDLDGAFSVVAEYDGEPNGLKIHHDGRIFIADFRHGLMQLDPDSGHVESVLGADIDGRPFHGLNDLFFTPNGDLYFTDQGMSGLHDPYGRLYCLRAGGKLDLILDRIPSPNGLVVTPDMRTVFLNVTRDNAVWRVPLDEAGRPYKVGAFIRLSGGVGPDGLAMNEKGELLVAHIGLGCVWHFDTRGEPVARLRAPVGAGTTNLAFGGSGNRRLFVTESETGQILYADMDVPGMPMFSGA